MVAVRFSKERERERKLLVMWGGNTMACKKGELAGWMPGPDAFNVDLEL
jgi:hypothetical protein